MVDTLAINHVGINIMLTDTFLGGEDSVDAEVLDSVNGVTTYRVEPKDLSTAIKILRHAYVRVCGDVSSGRVIAARQ
jgi:hypothetical protein